VLVIVVRTPTVALGSGLTVVTAGFEARTGKLTATLGAAPYSIPLKVPPGCVAVKVQVPEPTMVTMLFATLQTASVEEVTTGTATEPMSEIGNNLNGSAPGVLAPGEGISIT
jgi:hypothetical protein